jgi:hypothetical protein
LTWRCGLPDDDEEVVALSVTEDDRVGVPPTVLEDDEVSGVVHLNCLRASCFGVVELWPLRTPPPLA